MAIPFKKMMFVGILPSYLKVLYYRLNGAKIGKNVSIGFLTIIDSPNIEIGDFSKIGSFTFINCKSFKLGKRVCINSFVAIDTGLVEIDNDSIIMEQVVIGGMLTSRSKISIGKRVKVFPFSFLNPTEPIILEDDVGIGGANYIFTHGSWQSKLDGFPIGFGPVTIKKGTWFPWRVFVMPNVTVGEYCTIGAGSMVTKDIPDNSLAIGIPAKIVKTNGEYRTIYSDEDKNKIIIEILNEFVDFMQYSEYSVTQIHESDYFKINLNGFNILFSNKELDLNNVDYFITFNSDLIDLSINYFDLKKNETKFSQNKEWNLIKDFFSRYGIRFEVLD